MKSTTHCSSTFIDRVPKRVWKSEESEESEESALSLSAGLANRLLAISSNFPEVYPIKI